MMSYAIPRKLITILSTRPRIWACSILLFWTLLLETGLLHKKYDLFSGGFLQPFSYTTWGDRAVFLLLSILTDTGLILIASEVWQWAAQRLTRSAVVVWYNFFSFGMFAVGLWIFSKYQLLSYFNDTINFTIITNLGGGSLVEAISYVTNEIAVVLFVICGLVLMYWLGLRAVRRAQTHDTVLLRPQGTMRRLRRVLLAMLLVVSIVTLTDTMPWLKYGMSKVTSFSLVESMLNTVTDFDFDGYGLFGRTHDPAPFDSGIYPFALDIPGNGIDEDGYAGDLPLLATTPCDGLAAITPHSGKHIVLIVLESARADLIGKEVDGKSVAPIITRLAQTGSSAAYAYSHTGYTVSSLKALFNRSLIDSAPRLRLADFLKSAGYQLSFLSGQDESFGEVDAAVGMSSPDTFLFDARSAIEDRVYPSKAAGSLRLSEERIVQSLRERVQAVDWRRPQFIYINFQAAHFPYDHPKMRRTLIEQPIPRSEISAGNQKWLAATYWNAIASADWATGEVIDALKYVGVWDRTTLAVVGDHGESLFDDKFLGHGHAINATQTRIPFVINQIGVELRGAIGQIDIAEIVVRVALNEMPYMHNNGNQRVFQFVGSLDQPQQIGLVAGGEQRTVLDLRDRMVFSPDLKYVGQFDSAVRDPRLHDRVVDLVNDWANLRWEAAQIRKTKILK